MRLRTAESFWLLKNGLLHTYPTLSKNLTCDTVVVGAGITGALLSHSLRTLGHKIIVVDKRDVGSGSTSATTAMLQYEVDEPLNSLGDMIGIKGAEVCYQAGVQAIDDMAALVKKLKIDCGFELKDSLYMAHSKDAAENLKIEFVARKKAKLPVSWLSALQVKKRFGLKSFGAILSRKGASLDAYKFTHALLNHHTKKDKLNFQVFDNVTVKKVEETRTACAVKLDSGHTIKCKNVVFCSGFESIDFLKENVVDLFDTYACVSEPLKISKALSKTLVWNTQDPYFYMRTTDDNRLLLGGEDSSFRIGILREKLKSLNAKKLQSTLKDILPKAQFVEDYTWAGTFGKTKDSLPYIGKPSEYKNTFFVLGFGGNGITFSIQAMTVLPALLQGKDHALAEYYKFSR